MCFGDGKRLYGILNGHILIIDVVMALDSSYNKTLISCHVNFIQFKQNSGHGGSMASQYRSIMNGTFP